MPEAMQVRKESKTKPWNKNIWQVAKATPWKGICCSRCYAAKSEKKRCKCRCRGMHHGEAYKPKGDEKKTEDQEEKQ